MAGKKISKKSRGERKSYGMEIAALGLLVLAGAGLGVFALWRTTGGNEGLELQGGLTLAFGTRGEAAGQFSSPRGICAGPEGFAVADPGRDKILIFDTQGRFEREFSGDPQSKPYGELLDPHGVSLMSSGHLIVADPRALRVFTWTGSEMEHFDGEALAFYSPRAVAATPDGGFIAADTGNGKLGVVNTKGEKTAYFGGPGGDALLEPKAVIALRNGQIAATDKSHKIYIFSPAGEIVKTIKIPQSQDFGPSQEHALAEAPDGTLAVADPDAHRVRLFGGDGKPKGWLGRGSAGDSVEEFIHPMGLVFLRDGRLAVADSTLGKVLVLRLVP